MASTLTWTGERPLAPRWRAAIAATIASTWALMVLGALTRASSAGVACPDWPLCHGYVVPPLARDAYPPDSSYEVAKVYLEFLHRALAGLVAIGAVGVGLKAWTAGARAVALALWALLALQVLAGAVTVWLENAPSTVVLHLALALAFLAALLQASRRLAGPARARPAPRAALASGASLLALVTAQMLVGAAVSSGYAGLACERFPLCGGGLLPDAWTGPVAWQMAHRALGALVLASALAMAVASWRRAAARADRAVAIALALGIAAEVLLGGVNVWLGIPPWASAAHLGLAAALFALAARWAIGARDAGASA